VRQGPCVRLGFPRAGPRGNERAPAAARSLRSLRSLRPLRCRSLASPIARDPAAALAESLSPRHPGVASGGGGVRRGRVLTRRMVAWFGPAAVDRHKRLTAPQAIRILAAPLSGALEAHGGMVLNRAAAAARGGTGVGRLSEWGTMTSFLGCIEVDSLIVESSKGYADTPVERYYKSIPELPPTNERSIMAAGNFPSQGTN
jgi:hypothetical protein